MRFTSYICIYNIIFYLIYILKKIHGPPKLYFLVPPLLTIFVLINVTVTKKVSIYSNLFTTLYSIIVLV
jgi:hypothetical protein